MGSCTLFHTTGLLSRKWMLPLLQEISRRPNNGFNSLCRSMRKISPKVLAERLSELEHARLILKNEYMANRARTTEYALTPKGAEFKELLESIRDWHAAYDSENACLHRECLSCPRY